MFLCLPSALLSLYFPSASAGAREQQHQRLEDRFKEQRHQQQQQQRLISTICRRDLTSIVPEWTKHDLDSPTVWPCFGRIRRKLYPEPTSFANESSSDQLQDSIIVRERDPRRSSGCSTPCVSYCAAVWWGWGRAADIASCMTASMPTWIGTGTSNISWFRPAGRNTQQT